MKRSTNAKKKYMIAAGKRAYKNKFGISL
jgi:hypothetical protein